MTVDVEASTTYLDRVVDLFPHKEEVTILLPICSHP